ARGGAGIAEAGGVSVSSPCTSITPHVAGPTTPSTESPWRACMRRTAASVSGPNWPSAGSLRAACRRATAAAVECSGACLDWLDASDSPSAAPAAWELTADSPAEAELDSVPLCDWELDSGSEVSIAGTAESWLVDVASPGTSLWTVANDFTVALPRNAAT